MSLDAQALVVGGGPSGARVAELLARRGIDVLLLEAEGPDVDNLCSGLLNPEGQAALGRDVPAHVRRAPFTPSLEFHDADNRLRRRYDPRYWNMDRPSFDAWLRELADEAGARVEYHRRVARIESTPDGVRAYSDSGVISARVAIDATGWKALSRRGQSPAPQVHAFQGVVECELPEASMWAVFESAATPYYGWLVPKGDGKFLLGAGFPKGTVGAKHASPVVQPEAGQLPSTTVPDAQARPAGEACFAPTEWAKLAYLLDYLAKRGCKTTLVDAKPLGCPITTITSTRQLWWGGGRVFPVGEAAGLVSPSSGDGIHFGLEHAAALADALADSGELDGSAVLDGAVHKHITSVVQRRLRPSLSELRFNCLKSRVAANPALRGIATRLLPLYLRRPVERMAL